MKFINARTGGAVKPTALLINGDPVNFSVEAGSLAVLALPSGKHSAEIQASGYISMTVDITVADAANPVMTFELDPASTQTVEPVPPNVALLEGYVTDADTGTLLDGVTVTLPDAEMSTTTDTSGRYSFQVNVPPSKAARPSVTMEVQSADYVPLRFKNLALAAGELRSMPVQLERITSETQQLDIRETDESAVDGAARNYEWVYDVTVR